MRRMITDQEVEQLAKLAYIKIEDGAVLISTLNNSSKPGNAHFLYINSSAAPVEHLHVDEINLGDNKIKNSNNLIVIDELPTSDPEVAGALWNDQGALKISAGESQEEE